MNYEAKSDAGKAQIMLVPPNMILDIARLEEYDQRAEQYDAPKMIGKAYRVDSRRKALFECPFCGKEFEADVSNVMSGRQRSCGCAKGRLSVESRGSHGASKTRLYRIWAHIKERCNTPTCKEYKWYGARGIKCEFGSFEEFRDYALAHGYNDNLTCERIDVDGNYAPGNVAFIPLKLQARNTRSNVKITYNGLTLCASEWGELLGINPDTITKRKRSGWTDVDALKPVDENGLDISLVPVEVIRAIRAIRLFGVTKYPAGGVDNWKQVEPERYWNALMRHALACMADRHSVDPESGLPHLWHLACNAAFLCDLEHDALVEAMT